jgi:4-amino-4-deoxy-L-arabinose transferase-like glycosyltransferase
LSETPQNGYGLTALRKPAVVAAGLAAFICLFGQLAAIGLVGPDEPRYVWISRAMAETGDWITPRLYAQPWFEKPVLYYWAAAIGFLLHLPAEWAARLPSAFSALAAALAIGVLGWKHYDNPARLDRSPALLAPLLFSTSVAAIGFARAATPDMLFSALITLAMASAASVFRRVGALRSTQALPKEDTRPIISFGIFLGLAVLAKGPAAIILAGGAVLLWVFATRQWRAALRLLHPFSIGAFCVVSIPWYLLCAFRNPDFLQTFIVQHNFERYLTPIFQHRQPFWFFGPIVLLALLPWTILLWPAAQEGVRLWRYDSWRKSPGFYFFCWGIFPVLFFSFSQSKLPGYVLPAIPPLTLLCAVGFARVMESKPAGALFVGCGIALSWLGILVFALYAAHRLQRTQQAVAAQLPWHAIYAMTFLIGCAAIAVAVAGFGHKPQYIVAICALCVAATVECANLLALPTLDSLVSARPYVQFLRNDRRPDRMFTYHLPRGWDWGLNFYFQRELPEWSPVDPDAALVLTNSSGLAEIRKLGRFRGELDEPYAKVLYVPINQAPR